MGNELVSVTQYSEIPEWLSWEIINIIDVTKELIKSISEKKWPNRGDLEYDEIMFQQVFWTIRRLYTNKVVSAEVYNRLNESINKKYKVSDAINLPFFLLEVLYFEWIISSDRSLLLEVREVLIAHAKETNMWNIIHIDGYISWLTSDERWYTKERHIHDYACEVVGILLTWQIQIWECDYMEKFIEYVIKEDILSKTEISKIMKCGNITLKIYFTLYNLLLKWYFEEDMDSLLRITECLLVFFENINENQKREHILEYISQFTEDLLPIGMK